MPRQRIHHTRETYDFPDDFPERLKRFQEESRWVLGRARPSMRHMMALLELAEELGLAHLFTD